MSMTTQTPKVELRRGIRRITWLLLIVAATAFAASVWLLTQDVYSDSNAEFSGVSGHGEASFCGAAYDVIWLEGDGFMGGEVAANQALLDKQCVKNAGKQVSLASALAGAGLVLLALGVKGVASDKKRSASV